MIGKVVLCSIANPRLSVHEGLEVLRHCQQQTQNHPGSHRCRCRSKRSDWQNPVRLRVLSYSAAYRTELTVGLDLNIVSPQHGNLRWALGWMKPAADYLDASGFLVIPEEGAYVGKPANVMEAAIDRHDRAKIDHLISTGIDLNTLPDPPEKSPHQSVRPAIATAAQGGATAIVQRHWMRVVTPIGQAPMAGVPCIAPLGKDLWKLSACS